jgi:hypothetical protein
MIQPETYIPIDTVADTVRLALAPVFLLTAIGAFLNVCASRLSRIVDRSREIEPLLLNSRGPEHDRWLGEMHILDRRMRMVSSAISLSVFSAVLTCLVVAMLFAANFVAVRLGVVVALLFITAMAAMAIGFAIFLVETRLGARAVRIRSELLQHRVDEAD